MKPAAQSPSNLLIADRLSDRLAALLSGQITSRFLRAGDRLPTEQQLALRHGVSRTVVREAMHQLESRRLVRARQGGDVFIAPSMLNSLLVFDPHVLESVQSVVQVVEVRRVLEGEISALAAKAQIATMRRAMKSLDNASRDGKDGGAEDMSLHRAIGEGVGNPQFRLLLGFLEQYLLEGMRITRGNEARRQDFMNAVRLEHRAIVDAIAAHDPVLARRCATEHLVRGEQRLVEGGVISGLKRKSSAKRNPVIQQKSKA